MGKERPTAEQAQTWVKEFVQALGPGWQLQADSHEFHFVFYVCDPDGDRLTINIVDWTQRGGNVKVSGWWPREPSSSNISLSYPKVKSSSSHAATGQTPAQVARRLNWLSGWKKACREHRAAIREAVDGLETAKRHCAAMAAMTGDAPCSSGLEFSFYREGAHGKVSVGGYWPASTNIEVSVSDPQVATAIMQAISDTLGKWEVAHV